MTIIESILRLSTEELRRMNNEELTRRLSPLFPATRTPVGESEKGTYHPTTELLNQINALIGKK